MFSVRWCYQLWSVVCKSGYCIFSTCLITPLTMETFKANHRVYFPNRPAEIRHILRSQRVLVNRRLGAWWEDTPGLSARGMRRISACCTASSPSCLGGSAGTGGNQNRSSHQIISDWKFWEVSYALCSVSHRFSHKSAMWKTEAFPS